VKGDPEFIENLLGFYNAELGLDETEEEEEVDEEQAALLREIEG
jgi:hypothetical protein